MSTYLSDLEEQVAAALLAVNPNTSTSYPDAVWSGDQELDWPQTVYSLESETLETRARTEARVRVTLHVDTFARSRTEAAATADAVRAAMLKIFARCTLDRTYDSPQARIVRRAQSYTGVLHIGDGIIYNA